MNLFMTTIITFFDMEGHVETDSGFSSVCINWQCH